MTVTQFGGAHAAEPRWNCAVIMSENKTVNKVLLSAFRGWHSKYTCYYIFKLHKIKHQHTAHELSSSGDLRLAPR